jgi:hypothetical protein
MRKNKGILSRNSRVSRGHSSDLRSLSGTHSAENQPMVVAAVTAEFGSSSNIRSITFDGCVRCALITQIAL